MSNNKVSELDLPSKDDLIEECNEVVKLENNKGFAILMRDLNKEIQDRYGMMISGTKDRFDENKGYLMGVNFVPNMVKSYKSKLKHLRK